MKISDRVIKTVLISLQQDGSCSNLTSIHLEFEWFIQSKGCQDRRQCEQSLNILKGVFTFRSPHKFSLCLQQISKRGNNRKKVGEKTRIISSHFQKSHQFTFSLRTRKFVNCYNFNTYRSHFSHPNNLAQISHS